MQGVAPIPRPNRRTGENKICLYCLCEFYVPKSRIKTAKHCSPACYLTNRWKDAKPVGNCAECGNVFRKTAPTRICCGNSCARKYLWRFNRDRIVKSQKLASQSAEHKERFAKVQNDNTGRSLSESTKAKLRAARMRQKLPTRMTNIETILNDAFTDAELIFEMHRPMFGRFQPDFTFVNEKVIVQADGDYWHSLPKVIKRDQSFNQRAASDGWMVLRFPEHKIHTNLDDCLNQVLAALKQ